MLYNIVEIVFGHFYRDGSSVPPLTQSMIGTWKRMVPQYMSILRFVPSIETLIKIWKMSHSRWYTIFPMISGSHMDRKCLIKGKNTKRSGRKGGYQLHSRILVKCVWFKTASLAICLVCDKFRLYTLHHSILVVRWCY